jgi:hypothetical protein
LLSNGTGGFQLSTDVQNILGSSAWTAGATNVAFNARPTPGDASITINYADTTQQSMMVQKVLSGELVLTQSLPPGTGAFCN